MVIFLNILPELILAIGAAATIYLLYKKNKIKAAGFTILATVLVMGAVNLLTYTLIGKDSNLESRLPTPTVTELEVAAEEAPAIRDIQRKPERDSKESDEHFAKMVDWKSQYQKKETVDNE